MYSYGVPSQTIAEDDQERYIEEIIINGFTIIPNVLTRTKLVTIHENLKIAEAKQAQEMQNFALATSIEANLVRCPLLYDECFLELAANKTILDITKKILGDYILLNQQNAVTLQSSEAHYQSAWHRDLLYQEFIISKPLALSALFCIDDFKPLTGGTCVLPYSHRNAAMPSKQFVDKWKLDIVAEAGSVLLFDSMLFHRSGNNHSGKPRLGINHVYTAPLIKQQIDLSAALAGKYAEDPELNRLLGYTSSSATSVAEFRRKRIQPITNPKPEKIS